MSRTRINLTRLLHSCDKLSAGGLNDRAERRRFETYLTTLQRLWHELAALPEGTAVSDATLAEYRRKIERLAELLDADKLLTSSGGALAFTQAQSNANLTREQANAELSSRLHATNRMQQQLRNQLFQTGGSVERAGVAAESAILSPRSTDVASAAAASRARLGLRDTRGSRTPGSGAVEAEALSETLANEGRLQEELIADLSSSASELRSRALGARQAVREDVQMLETIDDVVDANATKLDGNMSKLRTQIKTMSGSTCWVLLMLLVVCMLFVGTFLLMKVISKRKPPP